VLLGALERIEFGWQQGSFFGDGSGFDVYFADEALAFCLLGAVDDSASTLHMDRYVSARAKRRLAGALGEERRSDNAVAAFNDAAGRSKSEVLELLRSVLTPTSVLGER
jgi:hypothetical protein